MADRKTLGHILTEEFGVQEGTLKKALMLQNRMRQEKGQEVPLGKILVRKGIISQDTLKRALEKQKQSSRTTRNRIYKTTAELEAVFGVITPVLKNRLSDEAFVTNPAADHIMVAESRDGKPLVIMSEKGNSTYINDLVRVTKEVADLYKENDKKAAIEKVKVTQEVVAVYLERVTGGDKEVDISNEMKEFENLIKAAYEQDASDVHFFRSQNVCRIRFRVWGALRDYQDWDTEKTDRIVSVGFGMGKGGKDSHWKAEIRQRIRIQIPYNAHITLDCRYEHAPGDDGAYHACIRLMANDKRKINEKIDLEKLGFTRGQTKLLQGCATKSSGMVVLSGPTGSGKSTTLAALVKLLNEDDDCNILTVESPIERELPAFQTSVNENDGADPAEFANSIKSTLRRDPDVLMVGEIRDHMSAEAAASGVQTGHMLLTTVHAQSAIEIVERLASPALRIPHETIGSPSFISALVFQMLLPKLDDKTKIRITNENIRDYLDVDLITRLQRVVPDIDSRNICVRGTSPENPEGIAGMTICSEVISPDFQMRSHFRKLELTEALQHWRKSGVTESRSNGDPLVERVVGFTAQDHAIQKMIAGIIDPRDVESYFGLMSMQGILDDGQFEESEATDLFAKQSIAPQEDDLERLETEN